MILVKHDPQMNEIHLEQYGLWGKYVNSSFSEIEFDQSFDLERSCRDVGQQSGLMLIGGILIVSVMFILKLIVKFVHFESNSNVISIKRGIRFFMICKTLAVFSLPIAALAIWLKIAFISLKDLNL
jgi:hypothetical protein